MNTVRRSAVQNTWMELREEYPDETKGWRLCFDSRPKSRLGQCRYGPKEVAVSAFYVDGTAPMEGVLDTIRHEVAHILAGPRAKHGPKWKNWARRVGAKPNRCGDVAISHMPKRKYQGLCRGCDKVGARRHRRTDLSNRYHPKCGQEKGSVFYRRS